MTQLPPNLHPIPPGLWCVPSALVCLTGADFESVVHPALNRNGRPDLRAELLTGLVTSSTTSAAIKALNEMGYRARAYRGEAPVDARVSTWANRARERYPGRPLLVFTRGHALVVQDGRVFDNHLPHGPEGSAHSYARDRVESVWLVERAR